MADLTITALIAAGLFSGALLLAYDLYSTVVWRRQLPGQSQPAEPQPTQPQLTHPQPTVGSIVDEVPVPAVEGVSP